MIFRSNWWRSRDTTEPEPEVAAAESSDLETEDGDSVDLGDEHRHIGHLCSELHRGPREILAAARSLGIEPETDSNGLKSFEPDEEKDIAAYFDEPAIEAGQGEPSDFEPFDYDDMVRAWADGANVEHDVLHGILDAAGKTLPDFIADTSAIVRAQCNETVAAALAAARGF